MDNIANKDEINTIANLIFLIVPEACAVTLGGSRALGVDDELSDVEMYFYSTSCPPSLDKVTEALYSINCHHMRSPEFLWNQPP